MGSPAARPRAAHVTLPTRPPANSLRRQVPEGFKVLKEGRASILQRANDVFFNPAQVINRDMSIAGELGVG